MNRPLLTNFVTVGSGTALHGLTLDSRDSRFSGRLPLVLAGHVVKHSQSDHIKKKSSCICAYKITIRAQGTSSIDALLQFAIFLQKLDLYCFFCAGVLSSVKGFFLGVLPGELKNFRTALETGVLQFFKVRKN